MKSKKILAGVCASLMLAATAIPTVTAADTVKVTVGNAQAKAGATFSIDVELDSIPAAGINACDFGIKYDSSIITVTGVTAGPLAKADDASLSGVNALETNIENGLVSVIYGLGTTEAMTGSGVFLTLTGKVSASASAGDKANLEIVAVDRLAAPTVSTNNEDIIFGNLGSDNVTATVYTPTITNGWVEVIGDEQPTEKPTGEQPTTEAPTTETPTTEKPTTQGPTTAAPTPPVDIKPTALGDVDCNGEACAVADIVILSKYLINQSIVTITPQGLANANVNFDDIVDSRDLMSITEFALGAITSFD